MLNENEKSQIRSILSSPSWGAIEKVKEEFINHIKEDIPVRDTEWATIQAALSQAGKIEGIKSFIQELFKNT